MVAPAEYMWHDIDCKRDQNETYERLQNHLVNEGRGAEKTYMLRELGLIKDSALEKQSWVFTCHPRPVST